MHKFLTTLALSFLALSLVSCGQSTPAQPQMGAQSAPIEMLVFSDYKCAYCHDFTKNVLPKLKQDYIDTGILKLTYYDFPILNEDSWSFAKLSHCAYQQQPENFWTTHLRLFDNSQSYSEELLFPLMEEEGYNTDQLKTCVDDQATLTAVTTSKRNGDQRNVQGTPTFIVGSQKVSGLFSYSFFQRAIDAEQQRLQAVTN